MDESGELGRPGSSEGVKVLGTKGFGKHASSGLSQGHSAFLALSYWLLIFPPIGHLGGLSRHWGPLPEIYPLNDFSFESS